MIGFSILVAVYNAEKFLGKCLDSLLAQTYGNIQIICIDDCSTDSSLSILRDYAQKDNRIDIVELKENGGQAHARNMGLKIAKGKYIGYLDSDDWLAEDALQKVAEVFEAHSNTDVVLMRFFLYHEDGSDEPDGPYAMPDFEVLSGYEAFNLSLDWTIHGCYVARKEIYDRYPYDESFRLYSDDNTTHLHYIASREVRKSEGTYFYRLHNNSMTHKSTIRRYDYIQANYSLKLKLIELGIGAATLRKYENFRWLNFVDAYMFHYRHSNELPPADRKQGLEVMHKIWETIDRSQLDRSTTRKWGYNPMSSWRMFLLMECLYFNTRRFLMNFKWLHINPIK